MAFCTKGQCILDVGIHVVKVKRGMANMLWNIELFIAELLIEGILKQQELLPNGRMQTAQIVFASVGP